MTKNKKVTALLVVLRIRLFASHFCYCHKAEDFCAAITSTTLTNEHILMNLFQLFVIFLPILGTQSKYNNI